MTIIRPLLRVLILATAALSISACASLRPNTQSESSTLAPRPVTESEAMLRKEETALKTNDRVERERYLSELETQRDRRTRGY